MARLTDSEWKVMEALWQGGPQTLGEVLARLAEDTGWSRTTVHTYLTRMMAKGLVAAFVRSGQLGREERAELRRLLDEMEV